MDYTTVTRQMVKLYQDGMTLEEVGKKFGLSRQGVRHRFIQAGIPRRSKINYKNIDIKRLEKLYFEERLTIPKIAAEFPVQTIVIRKALKFHQIPRREPLKLGGYIVDFLRSLEINEKGIIEWQRNEEYANLHHPAKQINLKISIRKLTGRKFEITRLA